MRRLSPGILQITLWARWSVDHLPLLPRTMLSKLLRCLYHFVTSVILLSVLMYCLCCSVISAALFFCYLITSVTLLLLLPCYFDTLFLLLLYYFWYLVTLLPLLLNLLLVIMLQKNNKSLWLQSTWKLMIPFYWKPVKAIYYAFINLITKTR